MSTLSEEDKMYLQNSGYIFEEVGRCVILKGRKLPDGKFDSEHVDIMIELPARYPHTAPDMFYLLPWVKLAQVNRYPNAADVSKNFNGQNWQRWSRHNNEWRPGIDGIWTMLKRVEYALEIAS